MTEGPEPSAPSEAATAESLPATAEALPATAESLSLPSSPPALTVNVVTIFPEFFSAPLGLSIPARARDAGLVRYRVVDLRDFTHDRHRTVDDYPYGGGAGMVMKPEPFFEAVEALGASAPVVLMSARGVHLSHADAVRYAAGAELTLLCGHYKDVDQRVAD